MFIQDGFQAAINARILIFLRRVFAGQNRPENRAVQIGAQPRPAEVHKPREMLLLEIEKLWKVAIECTARHHPGSAESQIDQGVEFPSAQPGNRVGLLALFEQGLKRCVLRRDPTPAPLDRCELPRQRRLLRAFYGREDCPGRFAPPVAARIRRLGRN